MKSLALLAILLYVCTNVSSQQKVLTKDLDLRKSRRVKLQTFPAKDDNHALLLVNNDDFIRVYHVDQALNVLFEQDFFWGDISGKVAGAVLRGDNLCVYIRRKDDVYCYYANIKTQQTGNNRIETDIGRERDVLDLCLPNRYLRITGRLNEPTLIIYDHTSETSFGRHEYKLGDSTLNTGYTEFKLMKAISRYGSVGLIPELVAIDSKMGASVDDAFASTKIYVGTDSLFLVMDKQNTAPRIFTLDLLSHRVSYRAVPDPPGNASAKKESNSFILGNKIYYSEVSKGYFQLSILDFYSSGVISQFSVTENDEINFKNTPIIEEGVSGYQVSGRREQKLQQTGKFLTRLHKGTPLVTGIINHANQHELTIGAYKEMSSGGHMTGFGGGVGGGGMMMTPGRSWDRVTRFRMLVDPQTGENIPGELTASLDDRIDYYKKGRKIGEDAEVIIRFPKQSYYAYFDRATGKLYGIKF